MDPQTLADRIDELQVLDVREAQEWEVGHIEQAVNIPEGDMEKRLEELDRARPIVTVCRAGARSDDAAEWLRGQGFDAQNLDGGMLAWKWAGLPITGPIAEPPPPPDMEGMSSQEMQQFSQDFIELALAAQERFGAGVEPSEDEMRAFLRERLIGEGRSPEDADAFLDRMGKD
jgi:rhodanese-related sulfurtransferase